MDLYAPWSDIPICSNLSNVEDKITRDSSLRSVTDPSDEEPHLVMPQT